MSPRPSPLASALSVLLLGVASTAPAFDFSGAGLIAGTATDNRGLQSDLLEQRYTLSLFQELTPYVTVRLGYQFHDLTTSFEEGADVSRRSRQPLAELLYRRMDLSGRLAVYQQSVDDTARGESFDRRSVAAFLAWSPSRGPGFSADFRQDSNVADVSVFGRDVSNRRLELKAFYNRRYWAASYTFGQNLLENQSNQLRTDQKRHELWASGTRPLFADRLALGFSGRLSRINRDTRVGEDTELADPVPAAEGLFAVDTTPELGDLEPNPTLIDGDIDTPASPPIDIGGANTFRNVGLDLGITRPVSRLEIAVDTVSGPQLTWLVYHSRDNLFWEAVPGVLAEFDEALLRYRLRFPETEDRFFKAVNVSVNPRPQVLVTEVRALLDLDLTQPEENLETTLYRADLAARFRPTRRVNGAVGFGLSNDQTFSAGLVRRDFSEVHAFGRLTVDLARDLDLNLNYRFEDSEDLREPVLLRTVSRFGAGLTWDPLPTVGAVLTANRRNESEKGAPLQSLQSVRLGVATRLLPDLRLVSDLDYSRLDDTFAGRDRNTWTWRETLEMQPLQSWSVGGGFTWSSNTTSQGEPLLNRTQYRVFTTWRATAYLTMGGTWWYNSENGRGSLNQSYNVSYAPGRKLAFSATYQGFEGPTGIGTATDSLGVTYRLFTRFILFANLSRSRTDQADGEADEITNLRAGLRLAF